MTLIPKQLKSTPILSKIILVVLISFGIISVAAIAGSLTPSASPAGTMHTLSEIYDSIAGTFDSSAISSSTTGSLIQGIKALNSNLGWASGSNNIWNLNSGNVGIGTVNPGAKLDIAGAASISGNFGINTNKFYVNGASGNVGIGTKNFNSNIALELVGTASISGNLGIGAVRGTGITNNLQIEGANVAVSANAGNIYLLSNDNEGANIGSMISMGGVYFNGNTPINFSSIFGRKENGNDANSAGYFGVATRPVGGAMTERLRITSVGNVGIGTKTPGALLDVTASISTTTIDLFKVASASPAATLFIIKQSGNVGVGTSIPSIKLQSTGTIGVSSGGLWNSNWLTTGLSIGYSAAATQYSWLQSALAGSGAALVLQPGGGNVTIGGNGDNLSTVKLTAIGGDGTTIVAATSTSTIGSNAGIEFNYAGGGGNNTNNIARILGFTQSGGGGDLLFQTAPSATGAYATKMTLQRDGNFGIGATTPEQKLEIGGNITASASGNVDLTLNSTTCNDCKFTLRSVGSATSARLSVLSSASTELFTIASSGNVGVGTTTPTSKLDIPAFVPNIIASVSAGVAPQQIVVQGRYAYIVDNTSRRFHVFDVSVPSAPASISSTTFASATSSSNVAANISVQGRYAYIIENSTLEILDISNPSSPKSVGTVVVANQQNGIYVQGRYAYVVSTTSGSLDIIDVSNPSSPRLVTTLAAGGTVINSVYVQGRYAYLGGPSTTKIVDVSDPSNPVALGTWPQGNRGGIYVQGRYAYSTDSGSNRVAVTDISNPSAPVAKSTGPTLTTTGSNPIAQGRFLYLGNSAVGRLDILDITNPNVAPTLVGTATTLSPTTGLAVQGRYAYVIEGGSLVVFDVGSSYIQQLETGSIETGVLSLRNNLQVGNDAMIRGGAIISRGLQVTGPVSFTSSVSGVGFNAFVFDNSGNVGIGTNTPTTKFQVVGNASVSSNFEVSGIASVSLFQVAADNIVQTYNRLGTGVTPHRNISANNDLLVSGDLETLATATFNHIKVGSSASFDTWINIGQGAGLNIGTANNLVFLRSPTFIKLQTSNGLGTYFGEDNAGNAMSATIVTLDGNVNTAATTVFTIRDTNQQVTANTFAIRANTLTTGVVASISATSLTSGGLVEKWLVPASSSGGAGYLLIKDINNVTYASLGYGGRLSLARDIRSDGATSTCTGVNTPSQGCLDYAESFPTSEPVQAGDVVAADPVLTASVRKAVSETGVIGIVSSNPAALIDGKSFQSGSNANETRANHAPIALAGRVPVKVTGENGIIGVGDRLTISKTKPGYAMKATEAGTTIGTSLESFSNVSSNSEGSVLVFVNVGYWAPKLPEQATITIASNQSMFDAFIAYLKDIVLTVKGLVTDKVDTQQLCIGQTCVNEDQLKVLLQGQNTIITSTPEPSILTDSPTPTTTISETPVPSVSETPTPIPTIEVTASSSPSI